MILCHGLLSCFLLLSIDKSAEPDLKIGLTLTIEGKGKTIGYKVMPIVTKVSIDLFLLVEFGIPRCQVLISRKMTDPAFMRVFVDFSFV